MKREKSRIKNKKFILDFFVSINYLNNSGNKETPNFLKNNPIPRDKCFLMSYYLYRHDGMSSQM